MPEFSMPFNAIPNEEGKDDRVYYAEDFARIFSMFLSNGVYPNPASGLRVDASGTNLVLTVNMGYAIINGCSYALLDEVLQIALSPAHMVYNRKDCIILQLNNTERWIKTLYKEGKAAASPVAPALERNEDIYELKLAEVLIKSGAQIITQAEVTDTRSNNSVCGFVTHVVKSIDTTVIYQQYETYLNQQIAQWNSRKNQQTTDWQNQMSGQRNTFESQMDEIEGIYIALKTNIALLQTFDFENLASFPGCVLDTIKDGGGFRETVTIEATGKKVAVRTTQKQGNGFVEKITAYERDGITVMKEFTITTTATNNGYRTKISGVYQPLATIHPEIEARVEQLEKTAITKGNIQLIEENF